jgi:hypothetical protein
MLASEETPPEGVAGLFVDEEMPDGTIELARFETEDEGSRLLPLL